MEITLAIVCVCLLIFLSIVLYKLWSVKRNIRHFSEELEKLKNADYAQPVKVTDFDKDIVELAVKLNEHTDIQRVLAVEHKQSKEQLNNIISGISHDFRTPLTASLGYLQMIEKSGGLSEKNAEYLNIAIQKNVYLKELSDEFFELSKLENSSEKFTTESINLSNLISDMLMEQYCWMQERNITPEFDIADGIIIESHRPYVMRIVQNILSNAEKYASRKFGVSLLENDGRIILTAVNDTDDSSDVDINKVFEPFYKPLSRNKNGSGLGLYVVKCLCEKLGAQLTADFDEEGCFRIVVVI